MKIFSRLGGTLSSIMTVGLVLGVLGGVTMLPVGSSLAAAQARTADPVDIAPESSAAYLLTYPMGASHAFSLSQDDLDKIPAQLVKTVVANVCFTNNLPKELSSTDSGYLVGAGTEWQKMFADNSSGKNTLLAVAQTPDTGGHAGCAQVWFSYTTPAGG